MTCSKFYHRFEHDWLLFTIINCHDTNRLWMAVQTTRLDVGLDPLQRHNLIIQTVHTSKDTRLRFFWVFQKKKGRGFLLINRKISSTESFGKEKNPAWNLRKKTTSRDFIRANRPYVHLQFRWLHQAVWMVRIPRAQGDNWVIRRWHSVPRQVVFHSQQHHCNHPPSHQWSSHHHESKPLRVDALIWNGVDRYPEKNNLQTSSLPVVICMHPSLSDQQLGCKESLWVALTKRCGQKIILWTQNCSWVLFWMQEHQMMEWWWLLLDVFLF